MLHFSSTFSSLFQHQPHVSKWIDIELEMNSTEIYNEKTNQSLLSFALLHCAKKCHCNCRGCLINQQKWLTNFAFFRNLTLTFGGLINYKVDLITIEYKATQIKSFIVTISRFDFSFPLSHLQSVHKVPYLLQWTFCGSCGHVTNTIVNGNFSNCVCGKAFL